MIDVFKNYLQERAQLSDEQFTQISATLKEKEVKKGHVLLTQGDICSEMYFVTEGLLRSFTVDSSGKEHIVQFSPENWWTGDRNSFYYNEPSLFSIDAVEPAKLVVLTHDFFERSLSLSAGFHRFNTLALHNSIRYMQRRIVSLLSATAEERYLEFIKLYPSLNLRVPQWMIATYLGITPESLSRVRKELARKHFGR
ncbi:MAG: Crp/Fnr family transcriptional regulator [Mucilaginibacter polytrichastri]|nr:Crp/Fnr family transcriptional regulator [Mucilaginibacter polytrichastri]